ncbi:hypothetical protein [Chryseobacterium sp. SC28]|uniref:hypothetical protein n=1 Tax=Chryseobacterium sp. SC28 TaxID=2268028 RepID=UPI000F652C15|nr:hypothetical protein [Chryseobacterium sp. SC28]RRQ46583.1 hypothetical protein DTW91_03640 [Chryseobacterium sp. SC28]
MKPIKKNRLSDPAEFIKLMVVIFVLVSVFLFSQDRSDVQIMINFLVLVILFFLLQLVFVIIYKKGVKTLAFWLLILMGLIGILVGSVFWYYLKYGIIFRL